MAGPLFGWIYRAPSRRPPRRQARDSKNCPDPPAACWASSSEIVERSTGSAATRPDRPLDSPAAHGDHADRRGRPGRRRSNSARGWTARASVADDLVMLARPAIGPSCSRCGWPADRSARRDAGGRRHDHARDCRRWRNASARRCDRSRTRQPAAEIGARAAIRAGPASGRRRRRVSPAPPSVARRRGAQADIRDRPACPRRRSRPRRSSWPTPITSRPRWASVPDDCPDGGDPAVACLRDRQPGAARCSCRAPPIVLREGFVPHQFAGDARRYGARVFPGVPFMFDHFKDHLAPGALAARLGTPDQRRRAARDRPRLARSTTRSASRFTRSTAPAKPAGSRFDDSRGARRGRQPSAGRCPASRSRSGRKREHRPEAAACTSPAPPSSSGYVGGEPLDSARSRTAGS